MGYKSTLREATDIVSGAGKLPRLSGSSLISGDIHGDLDSLERSLALRDELGVKNLVLLGDYVDRGPQQVEVIQKIANQLICDPNFYPLRGNHEDSVVFTRYGFASRVDRADQELLPYVEFFKALPLAAKSSQVFLVHGGVPKEENFLVGEIRDLPAQDIVSHSISKQLLWNDPIFEEESWDNQIAASPRGSGIYLFGAPVVDRFLENNNLAKIIRAHSFLPQGKEVLFHGKLISLFSSSGGPYREVTRSVLEVDLDNPTKLKFHSYDS